jgi:aspartate/methionine/tyrosine aminotransferase
MKLIEPAKRIRGVEEYYFSRKLAEVRRLDRPERPIINLGIGSPDLAPAEAVVQALCHTAQQPGNHGYQNYKGTPALRLAIADFMQRVYGVRLDAEQSILPLMGSKEGIMHITMAFVNPGDEVLIPDPGYPTYAAVTKLAGATAVTYDLKEETGWSIDVTSLRQRDLSRVKVMWINFPHMPTGTVASLQQLTELVALARERNFLLVNDNPYSLILNEEPRSVLASAGAEGVALELNSLSKSHNMAGWRIGWLAGRSEYVDAVLRVKSNMDSGMFLGLQHAAVEALNSGPEWFDTLNATYRQRQQVATKIMGVLGCNCAEHQSGLFLWGRAPVPAPDVEAWLNRVLHETGVFITPGFIFGNNGRQFIRLSLCATEAKLNEALQRLQQWQLENSYQHAIRQEI